jgi:hypothetical protein
LTSHHEDPLRVHLRGPALLALAFIALLLTPTRAAEDDGHQNLPVLDGITLHGAFEVFQRVTLDVKGPPSIESGATNPFLDVRLDVEFVHLGTGDVMVVPGAFAADGNAAESGATGGRIWRAHLTPHEAGAWEWTVLFRTGPGVALADDPSLATALPGDGESGTFQVALSTSLTGSPLRDHGRLVHQGEHHLRLSGSGVPWLQSGTNSPENLLGYAEFDQTPDGMHLYAPHLADWSPGDPSWHGGTKGRGIVGALNYLASVGVNSVTALVFNVGGDGDDVWPWTSKTERLRYDVSKLAQWEIVFEHMDDLGISPQLLLGEQEIDDGPLALDGGELGMERKLFHRELLARFGHHLGLVINLGEENQNTTAQQLSFHDHLRALDAYDHPITVHTFPTSIPVVYPALLEAGALQGASLQILDPVQTHWTTLDVRRWSAEAGTPWFVNLDEIGPPSEGVVPDAFDYWHDVPRLWVLWGNLMAGGGGPQWYFGYGWPQDDLDLEDFRSREHMFQLSALARGFFEQHLPFATMEPADEVVVAGAAWCLAQPGKTYAAYLPFGGETTLALPEPPSAWRVNWFDPRNGGPLLPGGTVHLPTAGTVTIQAPASAPGSDWAATLDHMGSAPAIGGVSWGSGSANSDPSELILEVHDPDGDVVAVTLRLLVEGGAEVALPAELLHGPLWTVTVGDMLESVSGTVRLLVEATDSLGLVSEATLSLPPR